MPSSRGPVRSHVRVLVVGGGVMGASIALHLAQRLDPLEEPVLLVERDRLASGSSGRSGAVLRQFYADRELCLMARDSLREFAAFEGRTGYSLGFRRAGVLTVAGPGRGTERLLANLATMRAAGVDVERLGADEIVRLVPGMAVAPGSVGAFEPGGGFADPVRTVAAFAALARFRGATVREGEPVRRLVREGARIVRVETERGTIEPEQVVLAAGPWSAELLHSVGVELPLSVVVPPQLFVGSISPAAGALAEVPPEPAGVGPEAELETRLQGETMAPVAHPVVLDLEHEFYCRCEPESGRTRVGELDYADARPIAGPHEFEDRVEDAFATRARSKLARRLPAYADRPVLERQAAMYTLTPDTQAVLGRVPGLDGAYLVAGFSGHGFKLAPSVGRGMAQLVLGEPVTAFDPVFFSPERFSRGAGTAVGSSFGM